MFKFLLCYIFLRFSFVYEDKEKDGISREVLFLSMEKKIGYVYVTFGSPEF